mgnify:CR=1 FL=1
MFAPALRRSALGEVRQSPRVLALMLVMLVAATWQALWLAAAATRLGLGLSGGRAAREEASWGMAEVLWERVLAKAGLC